MFGERWEKRAAERPAAGLPCPACSISPSPECPRAGEGLGGMGVNHHDQNSQQGHPKTKQAQGRNPKRWSRLETGFKAIAGKSQSGDAIPAPTCLIWLSGFLGCMHAALLITMTLVLVICPARVEPWEFGNSLAPEHLISQPACFLATSFLDSGSIHSSPCRFKHPWPETFQQLNRAAAPS